MTDTVQQLAPDRPDRGTAVLMPPGAEAQMREAGSDEP